MDFEPTEEQRLIVEQVRRFVREEIAPLEDKLDPDASQLDPADFDRLVRKVKDMGLYGLGIPPEFGGPDIDIVTMTLIAMEISQHRGGLYCPAYGTFGGAGLAQLYEANEDQKKRYLHPTLKGEKHGFFGLTEPSGGSDPSRAIQTKAVKDGDHWIINGSKIFISGADKADFGIVFARTDPGKGRRAASPASSSTPTRRGSTCAASSTRYARRITPPSFSSRTCAYRTPICLARSTMASPSPTTA